MKAFLNRAGWGHAETAPVAADASARSFTRLRKAEDTAILMQDPTGNVARFADIARALTDRGFSAPRILAIDPAAGNLLMEDLGEAQLARLCRDTPDRQPHYYAAVARMLAALHRHAPPTDLEAATPARLATATGIAFETYAARAAGAPPPAAAQAGARAALEDALGRHAPETDVLMLRDLHAENILWLPDRRGVAQVGLIDIQDAMQGHAAYDMASLLDDARRDVPQAVRQATIRSYLDASGAEEARFAAAMAVQGAQRHLRVLGVFARLAASGKPRYVDLIPRVWRDLGRTLTHPALSGLARLLPPLLPEPGFDVLNRLRQPCPAP